jgi:hypothetical protein
MADVFISYKSERREAAEHLSRILEIYGYSVWFDYHLLSGRNFGQSIEGEIRQAKAAIVLWCSRSIGSHWVQEEASLARDLQTILPVKIEKVDLPLGFRTLDTIDVTAWNGSPRSDSVDKLLTEVGRLVGREPASWHRYGALTLAQFALDPKAEAVERKRERVCRSHLRQPHWRRTNWSFGGMHTGGTRRHSFSWAECSRMGQALRKTSARP